jgi:hypothetical protein
LSLVLVRMVIYEAIQIELAKGVFQMKNLGFFLLSFHLGFHIFPPENLPKTEMKNFARFFI